MKYLKNIIKWLLFVPKFVILTISFIIAVLFLTVRYRSLKLTIGKLTKFNVRMKQIKIKEKWQRK